MPLGEGVPDNVLLRLERQRTGFLRNHPEVPLIAHTAIPDNIDVDIDGEVNPRLLAHTLRLAQQVSLDTVSKYYPLLDHRAQKREAERNPFKPEILRRVADPKGITPHFNIADRRYGEDILEGCGFDSYRLADSGLLLLYKLPESVNQCWQQVLEFYVSIRSLFHKNMKHYQRYPDVTFNRINKRGDHDPSYYYLWEVNPVE